MRFAFLSLLALASRATAQSPRLEYTLRVDSADLSFVSVNIVIRNAPATFRLAMATHAEYDDQYWRYITDFTGRSSLGTVAIAREDSSVWRIAAPAGTVTLSYRVHYPVSRPMQQASWQAHLAPEGGLIGGPHSFLYMVGAEHASVQVTAAIPRGWQVATGLARSQAVNSFAAPDIEALIDSPMMVGHFRSWQFAISGVPHRIAYLGHPGGVAFDTALLVSSVERIARESARMFGRMPYHSYEFLFEDGAYGGLEHLNSVSIGARSADLARDPTSYHGQIAHEFFHTWNEVHLRPAAWIGVRHVMPAPTGELWWAEGVTLYYADLVLRRAGLPVPDSTRLQHLERLISSYTANPSHGMVSLEQTSRGFNMPLGGNGDFTPSMFLQGEVVGAMLDLIIRGESNGKRSLDDVMRDLVRRVTPARGYSGADVERAVSVACGCEMKEFFDKYVRAANAIDFNQMLAIIGLRTRTTWEPARGNDGAIAADLRFSGYAVPGELSPRLLVWSPITLWARAGLHTGDRLVSWNGVAFSDPQQLRSAISTLHIGDSVRVVVMHNAARVETSVVVRGYDRPTVHLDEIPEATATQRKMLSLWRRG